MAAVTCPSVPPTTNVYVDGLNLYYALRKTPYSGSTWVHSLASYFPTMTSNGFDTAPLASRLARGTLPAPTGRTPTSERSLRCPGLSIHYGTFLASKKYIRLVDPPSPPTLPTVQVHKMEEKGSDVNLASWMLVDAHENDCEVAVLVSNDSDLAFPVHVITQRLGRTVGLVNPWDENPSRVLRREQPAFIRRIRQGLLAQSQFPDELEVDGHHLHRPASW